MTLAAQARKAIKRVVLGPGDFPQQCVVGMRDPQSEVAVELHGLGAPRDVTHSHMLACAAPFTVGIGFDGPVDLESLRERQLWLRFRQRAGEQRLLGALRLRPSATIPVNGQDVCCFAVRSSRNQCLPRMRLWARYLHWAYLRWRRPPDVGMALRDIHAMPVFFICPRPVVLVSVADGAAGNLFPMNLMGPLGDGRFGFALNSTRPAASLVQRAGRLALSTVPLERAAAVRGLGRNHKRESIHWQELPFPMTESGTLGLPVPCFAMRVMELEVTAVRNLGSHTFFVARIITDERWADGPQFFMVHGIYQAWRQKMLGEDPVAARQTAI